jgi:hypothetical protein
LEKGAEIMPCKEERVEKPHGTTRLIWSPEGWMKQSFGQYGQIIETIPISSDKVRRELTSHAIAQITFIGEKLAHANIWR